MDYEKILIIIPAYNEADNLDSVVSNLIRSFPQYDYVIINDSSTDDTEIICQYNGYNYISIPINLGIGGTVQCGFQYALQNGYKYAVQLDGDGQHDPTYIENLLVPLISGEADMVVGSRFINKEGFQTSFMRRFGISIIRIAIKLCSGVNITDTTSGFRAVNKKLIKLFAKEYAQDYPEPEAIVTAVLNGYKVMECPVVMHERQGGISSISTVRSIYYMIKVPLALFIKRLSMTRKKVVKVE